MFTKQRCSAFRSAWACSALGLAFLISGCGSGTSPSQDSTSSGSSSTDTGPSIPAPVKDLYVDAMAGKDSNSGLSQGSAFKTLTKALATAKSGQSVHAAPGTYDAANGETFPLSIPSGVQLLGDEANKGKGMVSTLISGGATYSLQSETFLTGTILPGAGSTLAGFSFSSSVQMGIVVGRTQVTVRNNTISNYDCGIRVLDQSDGHLITGNVFHDNTTGLLVLGSSPSTRVEKNSFARNTIGIECDSNVCADLGGGAAGSAGGNYLACNYNSGIWTTSTGQIFAKNNYWGHANPTVGNNASTTYDIYSANGSSIVNTTGSMLEFCF